jgi:hypothetical protein
MLYVDYNWDLGPGYIVPDKELNTAQLGWKPGQFWQMVEVNGKIRLHQVDPMVQFVLEGSAK